jgi:hypothetical protein
VNNSVTIAVVAGAIIVAASMAVVFRYEVTPVSTTVAHRFDRWTGKIQICTYRPRFAQTVGTADRSARAASSPLLLAKIAFVETLDASLR